MTDQLLTFFNRDPLVAWLLVLSFCALVAGIGMGLHHALTRRRQRIQDDRRRRLERILRACAPRDEPIIWPAPPGPKGWGRRRSA